MSSPKTKEMLEQNYRGDSSGCNSECSVRSCATELGVNKTGVLQSCSCSIGFTVWLQLHKKNIRFSVYHMLPVPSWKDVWSDCSLVYSPSGNDSIGFSRLYLLKRPGGMHYLWLARGSTAPCNFYAFFLSCFICKFCECDWINSPFLQIWCRKPYASDTKALSLIPKGK